MVQSSLKVMHLVLSLEIGGTERVICDFVRGLDPNGISSIVCCLDEIGHFGRALEQDGYSVYVLRRKPGIDWSIPGKLAEIAIREGVDLIHAQQYTPFFYALLAKYFLRLIERHEVRLVFTEHGIPYPYKKKLSHSVLNPILFSGADELLTIAEFTKNNLVKFENFPAKRTKVVYNGVDLSRFASPVDVLEMKRSLSIPANAKAIGIVARLDPVKNHAMLLRTFQRIAAAIPDVYLLVVGDGPENESLTDLCHKLRIEARTLFLGSRDDVPALLRILDVFVLPSFSEGMSTAIIEAMCAGVPVVATRVGGNSEVVRDGFTGYLVEVGHDDEMVDRIVRLLQNDSQRQKMSRLGCQDVETRFTLEKMVSAYTDIYFNIAQRH
jgi:L-malate glycosyltransferase